jgi:peptidoglycan/LPS O-acetylase OafA/YrhL
MKLTYRPEIDGLRAIAVGAVILYHAQINILGHQPFKGGFIGVDIFFVISGYLITSIILRELVTTGTFSFMLFYERRIRRILPALLFVMLVSLPFAWMYSLPSSFIDFSKSILYSLGFSSNFYFHYSGQEYGAIDGLLKPFLHTWSLSVEEQFYILFPIVLLITFKYFRKYLIHILILGFIISLGLAEWSSRNYPSVSFYFLHTRMWELLAGSILAYFEITLGHRSNQRILNLILPGIGLILIGHSIIYFNDKMVHPSFYTLSPIIGVCLIIWFSNSNEIITKILSTKLFVGIGLISYSLYLWHYPIFAFARTINFSQGDISKKILIGIIALIVSILSYLLIERPCRNKKNKFKIIFSGIIIFISILIIFNYKIIQEDAYKNRFPEILKKNFGGAEEQRALLKNSDGVICDSGIIIRCEFNTSSNKKIYILGDSHMGAIMFDLKNRVIKKNYHFITSILPACMFFPGFDLVKNNALKKCNNDYFSELKQILSKEKNSIIIIGGRLPVYLSNYYFDNQEGGVEGTRFSSKYISNNNKYDTIQSSFKNEVLNLSKNNKVILIYPIPAVGWDPNKKIWLNRKNKFSKTFNLTKITTSYEVYKNRTKSSFKLLDSIKNDNVYRVYPHRLFCNTNIKNRCVTHTDKDIFYSDDDHPSYKGAEMINELIMKEIKKIEN